MEKLSLPILVLNAAWQPISVASVRRGFMKVFSGNAKLLDTETYLQHDFESWANLVVKDHNYIKHQTGIIRLPEVMVLTNFSKFPEREVKLTRRNLLIRDDFSCQYTGKKLSPKEATIDHIIPESRGGKMSWDNVVIASLEANAKKADRTPQEARMRLLKTPVQPKWSPIYSRFSKLAARGNYPDSWNNFISLSSEGVLDIKYR